MNCALINLIKPIDYTVSEIHLLEHCFVKKLSILIEETIPRRGVILSAETFLESLSIEVYFPNSKDYKEINKMIKSIHFDVDDLKMVENEKDLIIHETSYMDLTDEDMLLYEGMNFLSDFNILKLYNNEFENIELIERLNSLLLEINVGFLIKGKFNMIKKVNILSEKHYATNKTMVKKNHILGGAIRPLLNIEDIIETHFLSFCLGKNEKSIIYENYVKPFSLYLGYSIDFPLLNNTCILIFAETNEESINYYNERELVFSTGFNLKKFEELQQAFLSYTLLSDPYGISFFKYFMRLPKHCTSFDWKEIEKEINSISYARIKQILERGF